MKFNFVITPSNLLLRRSFIVMTTQQAVTIDKKSTLPMKEKFEDIRREIRSLHSKKDRQYNGQKKKEKGQKVQTLIYKIIQRKLKIEHHVPH